MTKVLITGGTGTIGKKVCALLKEKGHEVVIVSRSKVESEFPVYLWNPATKEMDLKALDGVKSIIHLAGASVGESKWTEEAKSEILSSRVDSVRLLKQSCEKKKIHLENFISASAIGWYPMKISKYPFTEDIEHGTGFLADVCSIWEKSADEFLPLANHVAKLRIGLVLDRHSGALPAMIKPINFFVGATLGSGQQAMPWIHLTDVARMFVHALENNLEGVYNAVGPEYTNNAEFIQTLADVVEKPIFLPNIPEFVIRKLFGEKADLVLKGAPISSAKIRESGFHFEFPTLNTALSDIYRK